MPLLLLGPAELALLPERGRLANSRRAAVTAASTASVRSVSGSDRSGAATCKGERAGRRSSGCFGSSMAVDCIRICLPWD